MSVPEENNRVDDSTFRCIRFPDYCSPVSAGWGKQRALNFTVPVSCSATIIRSSVHIRAIIGAFKWKYPTNGAIDASPTVKDDVVYIGSDDSYLYALYANTGALKWKYQTGSLIDSPAGIADGIVYFGSYDNNLHSLDGNTGGLKWKYQTGSIVYSSPAGVAYFGSGDGNIYAVGDEPVTGSIGVSSNPLGAQI